MYVFSSFPPPPLPSAPVGQMTSGSAPAVPGGLGSGSVSCPVVPPNSWFAGSGFFFRFLLW